MSKILVETKVNVDIERAWDYWTKPSHIKHWNFAVPEWHCPHAQSDLKPGGRFSYRMEAKDGSMGFDYSGTFLEVEPESFLKFELDDGRQVEVAFEKITESKTKVTEVFEPEETNPEEMQKQGWQMILNNFKKYVEQ